MKILRRAKERAFFNHGWLKTYHTFSFGEFFDPKWMAFGPLRVINEDWIEKGAGFPTHGHRDMEIVTYVVEGAVAHRDSTGSEGVIKPGEVQKMSAGRGIRHSEYNGLKDVDTHLYQIWIIPDRAGHEPRYWQKDFSEKLATGEPVCIVDQQERDGALPIHQDATVWARRMKEGSSWTYSLKKNRGLWIQVVKGSISIANEKLSEGDGFGIAEDQDTNLEWVADQAAEVLVFDMKLEG